MFPKTYCREVLLTPPMTWERHHWQSRVLALASVTYCSFKYKCMIQYQGCRFGLSRDTSSSPSWHCQRATFLSSQNICRSPPYSDANLLCCIILFNQIKKCCCNLSLFSQAVCKSGFGLLQLRRWQCTYTSSCQMYTGTNRITCYPSQSKHMDF